MKRKLRIRISKMTLATSLIVLSGICGFAGVAISAESATEGATNQIEVSNGSRITLSDNVTLAPIAGWQIERQSLGMSLVMKELLPEHRGPIDYSKPIFQRNISMITVNKPRYIDPEAFTEIKSDIDKMIARDPSLKDFTFTDAKLFDYKNKNDGIVLFSQLTANNYPMMLMHVVISGDQKSYMLTYTDLAATFSNPASFEAAWKSMTSINVSGVPPKRYEREAIMAGLAGGGLLAILLPFFVIRWRNSRKIRKLADELQYDWDHGIVKSDAEYDLSDIRDLESTKIIRYVQNPKRGKLVHRKSSNSDLNSVVDSGINTTKSQKSYVSSVDSFSTRHSRFG
jgi:hypothetical protein